MDFCSRDGPRTVKLINVHEVVHSLDFNFPKLWLSTYFLKSFSRDGPQTVKVIKVHEIVCGFNFDFLKFGSSTSCYCNHLLRSISRSMKWTTDHHGWRDFYFFQYMHEFSCIINKLNKSYKIHSIVVLVPCFKTLKNVPLYHGTSTPST